MRKVLAVARWPVVRVENYGPIKKAEIELRPLTVLVGRNNTGKSYLASLIYMMSEVPPFARFLSGEEGLEGASKDFERYVKDFVQFGIVPELFARPEETIRWGAERSLIDVQDNISLAIRVSKSGKVNVSVIVLRGFIKKTRSEEPRPQERWQLEPWRPGTILHRPLYLLAERAGILRVYRPLLAAYLRASLPMLLPDRLRTLLERLEPSMKLPRLAADFLIDVLVAPSRREGYFSEELKLLEEIMGGRVEVTEELEVTYVVGDEAISIDKASSLVAELAPLYMALERMGPDRSIIIEEPESHLHPKAQVKLCRVFARLVRKGVPILITTHSPLMLIALAHLVGLSGLSPEQRAELGYAENEYLRPDELAIYWLRWDGDGSVAEPVRVEPTGTIEELPEMDDVLEDLYGEEARLLELSALASRSAKAVREK